MNGPMRKIRLNEDVTITEMVFEPHPSPQHAENKDRDPYTLLTHELLAEQVILLREIKRLLTARLAS